MNSAKIPPGVVPVNAAPTDDHPSCIACAPRNDDDKFLNDWGGN
jgi:hypothetical protein